MKINDGGPAYPHNEKDDNGDHFYTHGGLTRRELFAALAMQAYCGRYGYSTGLYAQISLNAVAQADALLAALAQGGE